MSSPTENHSADEAGDELTPSPSAARRELGSLLKGLRGAAGLRLADGGRPLDRSPATMSRIENGALAPRLLEVAALLDLYGRSQPIPAEVRERALALATDARRRAWYSSFRDVLTGDLTADHIQRLIEFENDAREISSYEVEFIPGLLQTAGYARAVAEMFYPDSSERDRNRFVDFRLARQQRVGSGRNQFRLRSAIRETAVKRLLGGPPVMTEQLERLATDIDDGNPGVDIRLVPDALVVPPAMRGSFQLMRLAGAEENGLVYIEGREGADYLRTEAAVRRYSTDFETLWRASLSKSDSLKLLAEVIASIS